MVNKYIIELTKKRNVSAPILATAIIIKDKKAMIHNDYYLFRNVRAVNVENNMTNHKK